MAPRLDGASDRRVVPMAVPLPTSLLRSRQIGLLCLMVTAVGWGLNWPVMKVLLREWPPLFARGAAGTTAALGLALLAVLWRQGLAVPRGSAGRLVLAAMLNVFAWMGFSTLSLLWLGAGEGALIVYTMPIWATLLAWPLRGERPTFGTLAGAGLGVLGLGVLLGGHDLALGSAKLPGVLLALGAAVSFAFGTVTVRSAFGLAPIVAVAWQVGIGCAPMLAAGLLFEQPEPGALTWLGGAAMAYMTVVPMGLCYLCWFAALRRLSPATASIATLLTPLVGVVAAALALGEPLGLREFLALGLTLGGVALALCKA
jgi:drug/metabolite transporter (DMT)-like permease